MRLVPISITIAFACACLTPRSVMQQQLAAPIGKGAVEVGVGAGLGYEQQNTPTPGAATQYTGASSLILPGVEANAHFGVNDHVGVNLHFSTAGIQPGIKLTVNKSRVAHFALMPQLAIGYGRAGSSLYVTDGAGVTRETAPVSTSMFSFMIGLRIMVSHVSGFYAGVGYDLIATRTVRSAGAPGIPVYDATNTVQQSVMVNVGYSIAVSWLRIRPELAVSVQPWIWASNSQFGNSGGFGWAILPGFSLTAVTPAATKDVGADEDEKNVGPSEDNPPERERERDDRDDRDDS